MSGLSHLQDHEEKLTLHVDVMLPRHAERVDTPAFRATKHQMVMEGQGCWICGSKQNREVQHFHLERCLAEGCEWGPGSQLRTDFPDFPWDKATSICDFVDSMTNCRVYCKEHHTGTIGSIHH